MMRVQDSFHKHEPCPACGSRNNLARYKSGSAFCFGCGYTEKSKKPVWEPFPPEDHKVKLQLPQDVNTEYSKLALEWVRKYGLSTEELIRNNVVYSRYWDQLIFTFYGAENELVLWQARNFDKERLNSRKYFTQGDVAQTLPIYSSRTGDRKLIIVEDCISAIKLSRWSDSMPALSSNVPKEKLARLRYLYDDLIIWLDGNMYDNAMKLASQARQLGFTASAVYSPLDPKENSTAEINDVFNEISGLTQ